MFALSHPDALNLTVIIYSHSYYWINLLLNWLITPLIWLTVFRSLSPCRRLSFSNHRSPERCGDVWVSENQLVWLWNRLDRSRRVWQPRYVAYCLKCAVAAVRVWTRAIRSSLRANQSAAGASASHSVSHIWGALFKNEIIENEHHLQTGTRSEPPENHWSYKLPVFKHLFC